MEFGSFALNGDMLRSFVPGRGPKMRKDFLRKFLKMGPGDTNGATEDVMKPVWG